MTNTRNTPAEILETYYPVRLWRYQLQPDSGGGGRQPGGQGVIRELELLAPAQLSLLASRRRKAPDGLLGGTEGLCGRDELLTHDGTRLLINPPWSGWLESGSRFQLTTPGGGGWGESS
jgi:N-methylhydantoinase B/oxoprolinase/acetone carboxylase alpha subunit